MQRIKQIQKDAQDWKKSYEDELAKVSLLSSQISRK